MAMATAPISTTNKKNSSWVVGGLLALVVVAIILVRMFHDSSTDLLQQEGIPAAREGMKLSQEGKKLLPLEEQREMEAIYAEAFQSLSPEERQRFTTLAQKGQTVTDDEITETATLLDKALRSLSPEHSTRLWNLVSKAVDLAQKQAPPSAR
jgi:hypothetical protein